MLEDNGIFKFFCVHRNIVIMYKEFNDLKEALKCLFECCKRLDVVTNYDEAYNYIINYLQLNKNKVLKINK